MISLTETVRSEAAALHRLVELVVQMCSGVRDYPVYPRASVVFLEHVQLLGQETLQFLTKFPDDVIKIEEISYSKRLKLQTLRASWETLHEYLKPVLDADTLHIPASLVYALQERVNKVESLEELTFAVFQTSKVNYLEVPSGIARSDANDIAELISGSSFPPHLGLIGMPYSQGNGFILNCLLLHEMGHFAYQEIFQGEVDEEIDHALERMEVDIGELGSDEDVIFCRDLLNSWAEEIFCDLFAIALLGPAYAFALVELTGATLILGEPADALSECHFFTPGHPADMARFKLHVTLLTRLGWWKLFEGVPSAFTDVLTAATKESALHIRNSQLPEFVPEERFLQAFSEVCDKLIEFIVSKFPSPESEIVAFQRQYPVIAKYLSEAVVPSTIVVEGAAECPSAVVLINSGFRFYAERLNDLLSNIDGADTASIAARSRYTERLELWILKALEDQRLLSRQIV